MKWARMRWLAGLLAISAAAAENHDLDDPTALDHQLQMLKEDVLALNRDLLVLEEDLLFPASRQLAVYVSMDSGTLFQPDAVELQLNDSVIVKHVYTAQELDALTRGGSHQLWLGNVPSGEHELVAFLIGVGPNGREYRRAASVTVSKRHEPQALELKISDLQRRLQPQFVFREWQ